MTDTKHLLVDREGHIVTVKLNRPEQRNALSLPLMLELTEVLQQIGNSDARGVILAANGPVFSAGHHFADMAGHSHDEVRELFRICTDMMDLLQALPQPVVARVHGLATAAGCQLVATCDLAVAAASASFALPGGKGALFCHTPLVAVARNLGRKRALELAMTGDPIDARTAADWGLVNRVVPDDQLEAATLDLISRATRGAAESKAVGKQAYYRQMEMPQPAAYGHAGDVMAENALGAAAQASFRAFLDKRKH
ncbi:enoyl-CoA hydratase-related protein [Sandarakinorhabdus limnophila]|uniref:enoyl-CoA hydratase-related protein n=1 Tax=Sandarakinorhabdus limnophila TaxID=210512 RepID=UPI0026EE4821|nr:enoyl-CoA hydratase-related protein [Sandarakinorhabdus limnophila]